ncbi:CHAD domain-containing protein [Pseudomonas sp. NPDC087639]|uniref:CHAD domain-containing protein n=1 Tax=Pseudomonas sp. NPDC087639 TaxID=3364445 RepID=UPI003825950C
MSFADKFVAEVLGLQVRLYNARARLEARTDGEALHDLRIAVRRIRSLLRPFRLVEEMQTLSEAAAEVGRQTTPARDLEVLIQELENRKLPQLAEPRRLKLNNSYEAILNGLPLKKLMTALDSWPTGFRSVERNGGWAGIQARIQKTISKQVDRLHIAIENKAFDRHELRVLVKRTRYLTEAFPTQSPLSSSENKILKGLQSALGDWHDHYQWCQKAITEKDLLALQPVWAASAASSLELAETRLTEAAKKLPKSMGKKKLPKSAAK